MLDDSVHSLGARTAEPEKSAQRGCTGHSGRRSDARFQYKYFMSLGMQQQWRVHMLCDPARVLQSYCSRLILDNSTPVKKVCTE